MLVRQLAEIELLGGDKVISDALVRASSLCVRNTAASRVESALLLVVQLPLLRSVVRRVTLHFDAPLVIQVSNLRTRGLLVHCIVEVVAALFVKLLSTIRPSNSHLVCH